MLQVYLSQKEKLLIHFTLVQFGDRRCESELGQEPGLASGFKRGGRIISQRKAAALVGFPIMALTLGMTPEPSVC